jgi:hypothetical protein
MKKIRLLILRNEDPFDHMLWVKACDRYKDQVEYKVIDLTTCNWLQKVMDFKPKICLLKPSGKTSLFRNLYQERVDILVHDLNIPVFPSFEELKIYENKKFFAYWTEANKIPHPRTWVYYKKHEAEKFVNTVALPLVGKISVSASGKGIELLKSKKEYRKYIDKAFKHGLTSSTGPRIRNGKIFKRLWMKFLRPAELMNRLKTYKAIASDRQNNFVILQEYIPHSFEWRAVRIGDSFYAHKKLIKNNMASGSLIKSYENPPFSLLDFTKSITDKFKFKSMAIDIFETKDKYYLVNEMQCIFGQSDPYQMLVDGKPGRYYFSEKKWIFEEGMFNTNECFDERISYLLSIIGR